MQPHVLSSLSVGIHTVSKILWAFFLLSYANCQFYTYIAWTVLDVCSFLAKLTRMNCVNQ